MTYGCTCLYLKLDDGIIILDDLGAMILHPKRNKYNLSSPDDSEVNNTV